MYILTPHKRLEVDYGLPWVYENEVLPLTNARNSYSSSTIGGTKRYYNRYDFADYQNNVINISVKDGIKYYNTLNSLYSKDGIIFGGRPTVNRAGSNVYLYSDILDCGITYENVQINNSALSAIFKIRKNCKENVNETTIEIPYYTPSDTSSDATIFNRKTRALEIDEEKKVCLFGFAIQGNTSTCKKTGFVYGKIDLNTLEVERKTFEVESDSFDTYSYFIKNCWYILNYSNDKLYELNMDTNTFIEITDRPIISENNIYLREKNEKGEIVLWAYVSTDEFIKYNFTRNVIEDTYPTYISKIGLTKLDNCLFYCDRGNNDTLNAYYGDNHSICGYNLDTKIRYKLSTDYNVPIYIDKDFVYSVTTPDFGRTNISSTITYNYSYTGKEWKISTDLIKKVLFKDSNVVS